MGVEEEKTRAVNIRNRDDPASQKQGALVPVDEALAKLKALRDDRRMENQMQSYPSLSFLGLSFEHRQP